MILSPVFILGKLSDQSNGEEFKDASLCPPAFTCCVNSLKNDVSAVPRSSSRFFTLQTNIQCFTSQSFL